MVKQKTAELDLVFGALADPTRRGLLEALGSEERTVSELAEPWDMSLPAVSKHLGVLQRAGLLERRQEGRNHHLRFNPEGLKAASTWLETQRQFWEGSFDKLAAYLESNTEESADPKKRRKKKKS